MPSSQAAHDSLRYLSRWDLVPDGEPLTTASNVLLPVRQCGRAAMLTVATSAEERAEDLLCAECEASY